MAAPTRDQYRKVLRTWVLNAGAVTAAFVAIALYAAFVTAENAWLYTMVSVGTFVLLMSFLLPSVYFLVLGVLRDEEPPVSEPSGPAP